MCIIAYKKPGSSLPDRATLAACFDSNPDGAGLLIRRPGSKVVDIHKGFMTFDDFFNFVSSAVTPADLAVYHFRIATSGGINPGACHPFPVSNKVPELKALDIRSRYGFAHNGVLGQGAPGLSDTMLYIKDTLKNRLTAGSTLASIREQVAADTMGSRCILIDGETGETILTGDWIEDKGTGLLFSNSSYLPAAWHMPAASEDYYTASCPSCGADAEIISFRHGLYECEFCGCLFDGKGEIWAEGESAAWPIENFVLPT